MSVITESTDSYVVKIFQANVVSTDSYVNKLIRCEQLASQTSTDMIDWSISNGTNRFYHRYRGVARYDSRPCGPGESSYNLLPQSLSLPQI